MGVERIKHGEKYTRKQIKRGSPCPPKGNLESSGFDKYDASSESKQPSKTLPLSRSCWVQFRQRMKKKTSKVRVSVAVFVQTIEFDRQTGRTNTNVLPSPLGNSVRCTDHFRIKYAGKHARTRTYTESESLVEHFKFPSGYGNAFLLFPPVRLSSTHARMRSQNGAISEVAAQVPSGGEGEFPKQRTSDYLFSCFDNVVTYSYWRYAAVNRGTKTLGSKTNSV